MLLIIPTNIFFCTLQLGISSSRGIFQRVIESLLQDIYGVVINDNLVIRSIAETHQSALEEVLHQLKQAGLRVKQSKCTFMQPSVSYLGHMNNVEGLHLLDDCTNYPRCTYAYLHL